MIKIENERRRKNNCLLVAASRVLPSIVFRHQINMIKCRVIELNVANDVRVDFTISGIEDGKDASCTRDPPFGFTKRGQLVAIGRRKFTNGNELKQSFHHQFESISFDPEAE